MNDSNKSTQNEGGHCLCGPKNGFFSKKKKIEYLKGYLSELEEKALDIKEYIKELEAAG